MTRICRDSTNLDDIPVGSASLIGAYGDGGFRPTAAQVKRHTDAGSTIVWITTGQNPTTEPVADCETGDYLPWETVNFCIAKRGQGIEPTVYVSYDLWAATQTEFRLRGVTEPHWWIALWDGNMTLIPGSVASQRKNPTYTGAHYDESVAADFWPGVDSTYGPGGGTIGGIFMAGLTDAQQLELYNGVRDIQYAILYNEDGTSAPNDGSIGGFAKLFDDKIRSIVRSELAQAPVAGGGTEPPEPKNITLNIPSVPGTATGSIS